MDSEEGVSVVAGPMQHTMPCVGYVLTERKGADRLKLEAVEEVVACVYVCVCLCVCVCVLCAHIFRMFLCALCVYLFMCLCVDI